MGVYMTIYIVRGIKNIGFFCLKLALIAFWAYSLVTNICGYATNVINETSDYFYVRGFETYGEKTTATLNKNNVYIYTVDDVEYKVKTEKLDSESIDKSIEIYYDILEPEENILTEELVMADSFYSGIFRDIANIYVMTVITVLGLGFSFFILDSVKYNKLLWKQYA